MAELKASPRNKVYGLLADLTQSGIDFASRPFGYDNPPVRGLLAMTPAQSIANTLNELSYGGALGTGSGMTWKPKADTVDAAMTLIPGSAAAGNAVIKGSVAAAKKVAPAIERAVPRIMERGGLPAQLLGDMSQGTTSNIFIGPKAKTWDAAAATKAQEMAQAGVEPRTIWSETGTWKGPDGHWRQEIPDNTATGQFTHLPESGTTRIADKALVHPQIYEAYPQLNNITQLGLRGGKSGKFETIGDQGMLTATAPTESGVASVGAHEVQHAIQNIEGFARGGSTGLSDWTSPEMRPVLLRIAQEDMAAAKPPTYQQFWGDEITPEGKSAYDNFLKEWNSKDYQNKLWIASQQGAPAKAYPLLAGEAEARATQARIGMDAAQRRATFPEDSYDVPINQLIVRRGGLLGEPQMSLLERNGQTVTPPAGLLSPKFVYPQEKALLTAQKNAALPVEQGGLGLRPDNTPMERAKAMGINVDAYHGTDTEFQFPNRDVFASEAPSIANRYAFRNSDDGLVMPLKVSGSAPTFEHLGANSFRLPPDAVRSRFAAFDPMRINENDLLGRASPGLLGLIGGGTGLGLLGNQWLTDR